LFPTSTSYNVGIGTTTPAYTLDVIGTLRTTATTTFSGNVGIGTTGPNYKLDVSGNINMKKNYFLANNATWKSLNYKMTQGEGGGAALVMCSQHTDAASGHVALYLIRATHSSTTSITTVYIGGNLDMFSFRNNNGILEVKGWDGGTGLTTAASCVVISQGSS